MSTVKHRAFRSARTRTYPVKFLPKHCAGQTCLHDHAVDGRPPMTLFRSAVPVRQERAS